MYISNMTHFLDETGNIPKQMPKEARELASFFALVVDVTTKELTSKLTSTEIRCFEKICDGINRYGGLRGRKKGVGRFCSIQNFAPQWDEKIKPPESFRKVGNECLAVSSPE